jgi:beta-glucosidase
MSSLQLPSEFQFGVATAAYQIEGAVTADGRGPCIWDGFLEENGFRGDNGKIAADHYRRWREDVQLLAQLGVQTYRTSTSWSRVMPDGKTLNRAGLDFYDRLVDALLESGIAPAITLYHMDLPSALQDNGGWANRDTVDAFAEYVGEVARRLTDRVGRWFTVNEPLYEAWLGYFEGLFPPAVVDGTKAVAAMHHLLLAHGSAYRVLKAHTDAVEVGPAIGYAPAIPAMDDTADHLTAALVTAHTNWTSFDPIVLGEYPDEYLTHPARAAALQSVMRDGDLANIVGADFLGVNYYFPRYVTNVNRADDPTLNVRFDLGNTTSGLKHLSDVGAANVSPRTGRENLGGWTPEPERLTESILQLGQRYGTVPILITENGLPLSDYANPDGEIRDDDRIAFIDEHLAAISAAVADGANVQAYYHWSLMDNLEWVNGYSHRFGLVFVDFATQRRTPKKSFYWYADRIRDARDGGQTAG